MFVHHCTACTRDQLIFESMFTALERTDHGTDAAFICWCGAPQRTTLTAARREPVAA